MRILTLVSGPEAVADAVRLSREIRAFNAGVDFRLRFLHIEIEEVLCVTAATRPGLDSQVERAEIRLLPEGGPLPVAATLAILAHEQRPDLVVIVGTGPLRDAGLAAASAAARPVAFFAGPPTSAEGSMDLGGDPGMAIEKLTGVAREVR